MGGAEGGGRWVGDTEAAQLQSWHRIKEPHWEATCLTREKVSKSPLLTAPLGVPDAVAPTPPGVTAVPGLPSLGLQAQLCALLFAGTSGGPPPVLGNMSSGRRRGEAAGKSCSPASSLQPPRILVVDIHAPSWAHTCRQLCEALENVFSLACSLAGPPRIPLLSLYVTWTRQECLLPFTVSAGLGFGRVQGCLQTLFLPTARPARGSCPALSG